MYMTVTICKTIYIYIICHNTQTATVNIGQLFMFSNMWAYMYLCIDLYRYIILCNRAVMTFILLPFKDFVVYQMI